MNSDAIQNLLEL